MWGVLVSDFGGEEGTGHTSGRMTGRIEVIGKRCLGAAVFVMG